MSELQKICLATLIIYLNGNPTNQLQERITFADFPTGDDLDSAVQELSPEFQELASSREMQDVESLLEQYDQNDYVAIDCIEPTKGSVIGTIVFSEHVLAESSIARTE